MESSNPTVVSKDFNFFKSLKTLAGDLASKVYQNFGKRVSNEVNYEEQGHLDALARLLHVQSDCAAVFHNKNNSTLYISFNSPPTGLAQWKCKQLINNLKGEKLEDTFAQAVLFSSTYSNTNFSPNTKKYFLGRTEELTVAKFLKELKELDKACVGTMEKKQQEKQKETSDLQKIEGYQEIYSTSDANSIINLTKYHVILEELKGLHDLGEDRINVIKKFLRPIQDIFKISEILKSGALKLESVEFLENKEKLHAEMAILAAQEDMGYVVERLGIAKLSCVLCEDVLEESNIGHRGTHGNLFAGTNWKVGNEEKSAPTFPTKASIFNKMINTLSQYTKTAIDKLFTKNSELIDSNWNKEIASSYVDSQDIEHLNELKAILKTAKISKELEPLNDQWADLSMDKSIEEAIKICVSGDTLYILKDNLGLLYDH